MNESSGALCQSKAVGAILQHQQVRPGQQPCGGISLLLGGVGLSLSRQIMVLLRTPENILDDATTYLNIYFLGLPFLFMYNVLSSMFNALGRSRIPLYLLIFSSVLNVALDIYMVGPLQMGVAGAAWATLIAQGISAVLSFCIFFEGAESLSG